MSGTPRPVPPPPHPTTADLLAAAAHCAHTARMLLDFALLDNTVPRHGIAAARSALTAALGALEVRR